MFILNKYMCFFFQEGIHLENPLGKHKLRIILSVMFSTSVQQLCYSLLVVLYLSDFMFSFGCGPNRCCFTFIATK